MAGVPDEYRLTAKPAELERAGLFVAEGRWVVERLVQNARYRTHSVLVTPAALHGLVRSLGEHALAAIAVHVVAQTEMDDIVGFNIHRGCLALAERPRVPVLESAPLANAARIVILEGVNNPDNVGGIFRSAAAFDVDLIVLGPACGDPLYRKAIRTSMGATLDVPYVSSGPWPGALDDVRRAGFRVLAFTPRQDAKPLARIATDSRAALLFGTEGAGLSDAALQCADDTVRIRASPRVDSLNVTVATSIALHHFFSAQPSSR